MRERYGPWLPENIGGEGAPQEWPEAAGRFAMSRLPGGSSHAAVHTATMRTGATEQALQRLTQSILALTNAMTGARSGPAVRSLVASSASARVSHVQPSFIPQAGAHPVLAPAASGRGVPTREVRRAERGVSASRGAFAAPFGAFGSGMGRATQSPGGQEHGANSIAGALKQFGTLVSKIGAPGGVFGAAGSRSLGEAGRYLNIAAGAAGIVGTGQQQGITLGSVLSGATSGAEIGSLFGPAGTAIGAGVGGLLDVIGGLFSHRHRPDYANLTQPALDNSPSDFDYLAYRYRATGSLTSNALNNLGQLPNSLLGQAQYNR